MWENLKEDMYAAIEAGLDFKDYIIDFFGLDSADMIDDISDSDYDYMSGSWDEQQRQHNIDNPFEDY